MSYKFFPVLLMSFLPMKSHSVTRYGNPKVLASVSKNTLELKIKDLYNSLKLNSFSMPKMEAFSKAVQGYIQLREQGVVQKDILTIVDFSLSSTQKRLWVIDMVTNTILLQSVVSHGRNSGEEFANSFSNESNSNKSSLGFYTTGETYNGKHGLSLKLDGLEYGINNNARNRAVVMHGADYAAEGIIKQQGRLGRSQGCPAVPYAIHKEIINLIKNKSCLFIYHPTSSYEKQSKLIS